MKKSDLTKIMNNILKKKIVFSNELDFQFYLAAKISDLKSVDNVFFESISFEDDWNLIKKDLGQLSKKDKQYTDLVVKLKGKEEYIAIELKYKTIGKTFLYKDKLLMAQGAYDIGSYLFVKDIERLAKLKYRQRYFVNNINVIGGFAIFLTNDYNYRNNNLCGGKGIWCNFSISESSTLENNILKFVVNLKNVDDLYKKYHKVDLRLLPSPIHFNWYPAGYKYDKKNSPPDFHFLIIKI